MTEEITPDSGPKSTGQRDPDAQNNHANPFNPQKLRLCVCFLSSLAPPRQSWPTDARPQRARSAPARSKQPPLNSAAAKKTAPLPPKQCTLKMEEGNKTGRWPSNHNTKNKEKGIDRKVVKSSVSVPHAICNCLRLSLTLFMVSPSIGASPGRHTNPPPNCCPSGQKYATELGSVGVTVVLAFCSSAVESVVFSLYDDDDGVLLLLLLLLAVGRTHRSSTPRRGRRIARAVRNRRSKRTGR